LGTYTVLDCLPVIRQIPGYPKVDRDNDYLMARFDGAVLDGKPWGRGVADGNTQLPAAQSERPAERALSQLEVRQSESRTVTENMLQTSLVQTNTCQWFEPRVSVCSDCAFTVCRLPRRPAIRWRWRISRTIRRRGRRPA